MRRSPFLVIVFSLVLVFLIGPFLIILISSVSGDAGMSFPPDGFSLQWYAKVFAIDMFRTTFSISLQAGLAATATALVLGIPVAYVVNRYRFPGKNAIEVFFAAPAIVPGLVIGFSLLRFFVYATRIPVMLGLYLGHTAMLFPYTVRVVSAGLKNFDVAVEEAAVSLGSSRLHAFFSIVFPNVRSGVAAAFVLAFITSYNNVPISLFLTGPGVATLPIQMLIYMEYYFDPTISALSSIIIVLTVLVVQTAEKLLGITRYL